jgi:hypothetical protein
MPYGTVNADVIQTSTSGGILGAGNASIMKNRIINGAMVISQRNGTSSVTTDSNQTYYLDRWTVQNATDGVSTVQQVSDAPTGFVNSLKFTTTTADASLSATQRCFLIQKIEGYNIADLGWGTANAKTVTLSFWIRSSLTGTFGGVLQNSAENRSYPFTYSISVADTWEQKSITVAGDTSGTWLTTNGIGLQVYFGLGVGSTYSGTAGAWAGSQFLSATGATSVIGTLNATWFITGVQIEVGSSATGYEYRLYNQELIACQRYFWKVSGDGASIGGFGSGQCASATTANIIFSYPVTMRTAPTIAQGGTYTINFGAGNSTVSSITAYTSSGYGRLDATISGATTGYGAAGWLSNGTSNFITGSAEL